MNILPLRMEAEYNQRENLPTDNGLHEVIIIMAA